MSTKSPSKSRKRKTKEEPKHETVAPVHKPGKTAPENINEIIETSSESNRTFTIEDKNDNIQEITRDTSIESGIHINSKIEKGIIGFMETEMKKEKSKYTHFSDSRPQSLSFYEEEKAPEELSGQLEQLSPEEKRVLKRRKDDRKIDIELDATMYKEIQNVLNREKEEALLAGIMKSQKSKRKKKQFDSQESINGIGDSREHMIPTKKKNKKSKKRENSPLPGTSHSKKKHRKREENEPKTDITMALEDLQDDVFEKDPNETMYYEGNSKNINKSNTVYVQKKNGFEATPRDHLFSTVDISKDDFTEKRFSDMVPLDVAISCQKYWLPFTVLCHGLLAGLALTHLIVTRTSEMDEEFIMQYKIYSEVYTALFFFLCVVCVVSVFDRYDVKHINIAHLSDLLRHRKSVIVVLIYVCALLLHLSNAAKDDRIILYNYTDFNQSNGTNSTAETMSSDELTQWKEISLWRSIFAIIGWVIVALSPTEDMLHNHLISMERYIEQST